MNFSNFIFVIGIILTLLFWVSLIFQIPVFQSLKGWFWVFNDKDCSGYFVPLIFFFILLILFFYVIKKHLKGNYISLILVPVGFFLQFTFALIEGRGLDGLSDRMVTTGHADFARVASRQNSFKEVTLNYEKLLKENKLGVYPKSKPPGHLLFYMFTEKIANYLLGHKNISSKVRLRNLIRFATFFFPFITFLVLIPIYYLSFELLRERVIFPSFLYTFIPSVLLITLHLDGVIYPLLFILPVLFFLFAIKKESFIWSIASAFFAGVAIYFSFSLMPVLSFIFCFALTRMIADIKTNGIYRIYSYLKILIAFVFALVMILLIFRIFLNFNLIESWNRAMEFHRHWKGWESSISNVFYWAFHDCVEFLVWLGIAVSILFIIGLVDGIKIRNLKSNLNYPHFVFAFLVNFLLILFLGKTKGETARLYLFFTPFVCIFAIHGLKKISNGKFERNFFILLLLQFITTFFIKNYQDFY